MLLTRFDSLDRKVVLTDEVIYWWHDRFLTSLKYEAWQLACLAYYRELFFLGVDNVIPESRKDYLALAEQCNGLLDVETYLIPVIQKVRNEFGAKDGLAILLKAIWKYGRHLPERKNDYISEFADGTPNYTGSKVFPSLTNLCAGKVKKALVDAFDSGLTVGMEVASR